MRTRHEAAEVVHDVVVSDLEGTSVLVDNVGSSSVGHTPGNLLRAVRVRQWTKNLLVFVAPLAAGVLSRRAAMLHALAAFRDYSARWPRARTS